MFHCLRINCGRLADPVAGFSLVKLLVSIGILTVILTVVVSNQSKYTEAAALTNLADDIASRISQAQAYGIGVREFSPGTYNFTASYGLTFSLLGSGSNIAYLYFADRNSNDIYDGDWSCPTGGSSECIEKVNISHGNYIDSMCVIRTDGQPCAPGNAARVDIHFVRPNTEANIVFFDTSGNIINPVGIAGARVMLKSPGGLTRIVVVYETGQISVQ